MPDTLSGMRASVVSWMRGSKVAPSQIDEAINDAIESLFASLLRCCLSIFMGGPTNVVLNAAAERVSIVSITDPTTAPTITDVVSGALAQHTVIAGYTLVTDSGTETLLSSTTTHVVPLNNVASVASPSFVNGAIGWNVYAGDVSTRLAKQNDTPIPFGTAWIENDSGIIDNPDFPSPPTENTTGDNIFYIRHMEVLTTAGSLKSWNQGDLDSDMMRRLGAITSSGSEYQNYGFDLINQRTIEVRPTMGSTLTARYFWIVKPRRLRFDNSPLPFPTVPSTEFIRDFALSQLFLSIREYKASESWESKSEKARTRCELAVTSMNRPKNQRVTPYRT